MRTLAIPTVIPGPCNKFPANHTQEKVPEAEAISRGDHPRRRYVTGAFQANPERRDGEDQSSNPWLSPVVAPLLPARHDRPDR